MTSKLFMDTSYAVALMSPRDQHHAGATLLLREIEERRIPLVTTRAVIVEMGDSLAKRPARRKFSALLAAIENDPLLEVAPLSEELYERGRAVFLRHRDKDWGLTDCISFVVMKERGLTDALTADAHFQQAGFRPLLR